MRGEHPFVSRRTASRRGSSPHARGAPSKHARIPRFPGIIPACAGSTGPSPRVKRFSRDHPRMRGEHTGIINTQRPQTGSSPHARGALAILRLLCALARIIPACAGSTRPLPPPRRARRDHPRMRGEHRSPSAPGRSCAGSSPHARGAQVARVARPHRPGIIPACAGSTACLINAA